MVKKIMNTLKEASVFVFLIFSLTGCAANKEPDQKSVDVIQTASNSPYLENVQHNAASVAATTIRPLE